MKFVFAALFVFAAIQLSESFLFNKVTSRPTQRPFSRRPWAVSGEGGIFDDIRDIIEKKFLTPFVEKVLKPLEKNILKPLEQNLEKKLTELKLNSLPQIKKFIKDSVIIPTEKALAALEKTVHEHLVSLGSLISKQGRDQYKKRFSEFIDTKLRQPFLERIKNLLTKIEDEIEDSPIASAEPVYLDTMKEFITNNIVTPFLNNVIKPIENNIIAPLEKNFKQKLTELKLVTFPQIKEFFQENVVSPIEATFTSIKNQVNKYIETFGVLISKENRDMYKRQFAEFIDAKIRLPLLERVKSLLQKIEGGLE